MRVVVFAPAVLHGDAWLALLTGQPGIEPAGGAAAVEELAPLLVPQGPTAVLVDLPVPDGDLIRRLRAAAPGVGLIVLVPAYDLPLIVELLQAGATGVVSTAEGAADLSRGLIAAGRGEIVLPPGIAARALSALARGEGGEGGLIEPLSEREGICWAALAGLGVSKQRHNAPDGGGEEEDEQGHRDRHAGRDGGRRGRLSAPGSPADAPGSRRTGRDG